MTTSSSRVARALLGTFSQDKVPADSKARAFAAFGVAAAVTGLSTKGEASGSALTAAPATATVAKAAATVGALSLIKAVTAGAILGAIAVKSGDHLGSYFGMAPSAPQATSAHGTHEAPALAPMLPGRSASTSPAVPVNVPPLSADQAMQPAAPSPSSPGAPRSPLPALSAPTSATRPRSNEGARIGATPSLRNGAFLPPATDEKLAADPNAAPSSRASAPATLTGEIARLDRARAALRAGAPANAMRELDRYDTEFASGSLRQEAAVLRIELLVEMGENDRARALAGAFSNAHPTSGYLAKIGELLLRGSKRTGR